MFSIIRRFTNKLVLHILGGNNKAAQQDDGYYVNAQKSGHGEKGYNYADQGSYAKGHDTKGSINTKKNKNSNLIKVYIFRSS